MSKLEFEPPQSGSQVYVLAILLCGFSINQDHSRIERAIRAFFKIFLILIVDIDTLSGWNHVQHLLWNLKILSLVLDKRQLLNRCVSISYWLFSLHNGIISFRWRYLVNALEVWSCRVWVCFPLSSALVHLMPLYAQPPGHFSSLLYKVVILFLWLASWVWAVSSCDNQPIPQCYFMGSAGLISLDLSF